MTNRHLSSRRPRLFLSRSYQRYFCAEDQWVSWTLRWMIRDPVTGELQKLFYNVRVPCNHLQRRDDLRVVANQLRTARYQMSLQARKLNQKGWQPVDIPDRLYRALWLPIA